MTKDQVHFATLELEQLRTTSRYAIQASPDEIANRENSLIDRADTLIKSEIGWHPTKLSSDLQTVFKFGFLKRYYLDGWHVAFAWGMKHVAKLMLEHIHQYEDDHPPDDQYQAALRIVDNLD